MKAEEYSLRAEERSQEDTVRKFELELTYEKDRLEKIKKQHELLSTFGDEWFEKMKPDFKYETHPDFKSLMKEFVISGGKREIAQTEDKLAVVEEGYQREKARLSLIRAGVSMRDIKDVDIDNQLKKGTD